MRPATSASPATPAQPPASTARPVPAQGLRRVHVFITGHVQGVGFRNFTQANAENLKLTGWVRNLSDGRVEAVVEGPPDAVAGLLKLLQRGPERAKVDQLDTTDQPPTGEFKSFQQLP
jgi:acylphosphatase